MKTLSLITFIFSLFILESCIQAPGNTRKSTLSSSATNGSGTKSGSTIAPTFAADELAPYWYTATKVVGTVTINKTSQDVVYLRGKSVHDFLSAKDTSGVEFFRKQYCIVGNFGTAGYKQVRVRAVPTFITTATKAIERFLRIDVPSSTDNTSTCMFSTISTVLAANAAYSLPEICTTCSGMVTTSNLNLYTAGSSTLTAVDTKNISLSAVQVRVDLSSNSTSPDSSCTNASCEAKGFDCCISGQCVKDAGEKINASLDPQYSQAKLEYAANPLTFINYPNIFYVCSNIAHIPPTTTTTNPPTPESDAVSRVTKYISDWTCINDVTAGNGYNNCRNLTTAGVPTSLDKKEEAYLAIKKKLSIACGCTASEDEMDVKCPDWGILPVYKAGSLETNTNIVDFTCYTPAPIPQIGPITNLNVSVPNRSAPHRFYSTTGLNIDDLTGVIKKAPSTLQEGDDFYYLDEYNKAAPVNGSYNINSVIGKMTIDLTHALPAKMVAVELGRSYILSSISGYFTPCSTCAKDSWFQTFTAHPVTQRGNGLVASGYTTSRDTYSNNTTYGNYEDTKFGRACYLPVTMLPLAHKKDASLQTQRQNRLKTQAAYYINGYQRDWFGFNKGALIGSFDGVTWFAVGTGRRITATSTKLFLAINTAFSDIADRTDTIVNIIPDNAASTAANYDYNPELSVTDPSQNTAGSCQRFHQCEKDADCVAQLGWEYTCADVSQYKTNWPLFDGEGKELTNQERSGTLFDILSNTISTTTNKRCIYRGAGAPCKRNYSTLTSDLDKKTMTCAPNFYCASMTTNRFNDELVRSPNELNDVLFGMDTNILGRPLNYVTANRTLAAEIVTNLKYNAMTAYGLSTSDGDDMGICRPGKQLNSNPLTAHQNADTQKRTDYISQIGACDSTASGTARYSMCPAFDDDLNYITIADDKARQVQNFCGAEAKNSSNISAFKEIEGLTLLTQSISNPVLAKDACLRRAGSICHTDLDCGPNKMHENAVSNLPVTFFGNTDAEQSYWRESLVCGQGTPAPTFSSANYLDYKLSENRCCREIGKDFTMFTQGPKTIIKDNNGTNNDLLQTFKFTSSNPSANYRYSRYEVSKSAVNNLAPIPRLPTNLEAENNHWRVIDETASKTCCGGGWIRKFADGTHDWKIRNRFSIDTSNFQCLNFRSPLADPTFTSTTANLTAAGVNPLTFQREYQYLCQMPTANPPYPEESQVNGCLQIKYPKVDLGQRYKILGPTGYDPLFEVPLDADNDPTNPASGYSRVNTTPIVAEGKSDYFKFTSVDAPYQPIPFSFPNGLSNNPESKRPENFFNSTQNGGIQLPIISFYLPAYVPHDGNLNSDVANTSATINIASAKIKYSYEAPHSPLYSTVNISLTTAANCANYFAAGAGTSYPALYGSLPNNTWCIYKGAQTSNRPVVVVKANIADVDWRFAGFVFDFKPIEFKAPTAKRVSTPGNPMYYLSKLSRLELIGIPQITYEPLYCNSDQDKVVPGIFKSTLNSRTAFTTNPQAMTYSQDMNSIYNVDGSASVNDTTPGYGNAEKKFVLQDQLDHAAVFSSKDFTCCTPLGKQATAPGKCCSGFAATVDGKSICKLPKGTDLHVYFNRFVSGEGSYADLPESVRLITEGTLPVEDEVDFYKTTGEPKFRQSTYDKISGLGFMFCDGSKVVTGGAFGNFPPEPFSGSYQMPSDATGALEDSFAMSIVDSVLDNTQNGELGKVPFDSGFKWNHHYYCK